METALTTALAGVTEEPEAAISSANFDQIVSQHQRRVYRVILLLVKDRDAADTLTQECFLRAYEKRDSFRGECRVDTWLLRIAVNLVRDYVKNRRASFWKRLIGLDDAGGLENQVRAPQSSPERAMLARAELEAVWTAVGSLSDQQRTVFLLRFVEEMPLAEIAALLGVKTGTVKAQLFRALAGVRKQLKEQQWR